MAKTVLEGLMWVWTWKRRHRVGPSDTLYDQGPLPERAGAIGPRVDEKPHYFGSPTVSSHRIYVSRVPTLESPGSDTSLRSRNGSISEVVRTPAPQLARNNSQIPTISQQVAGRRKNIANRRKTIPWFILLIFPISYVAFGSSILSAAQGWNLASTFSMVCSNLLFTDHGGAGIDNSQKTFSSWATILYTFFTMFGALSSLIFVFGIWQSLYLACLKIGLSLSVLKPIKFSW